MQLLIVALLQLVELEIPIIQVLFQFMPALFVHLHLTKVLIDQLHLVLVAM